MIKNPLANAGVARDIGLIPGLGGSPRGGNGNPRQYSCLGNPMDRGVWLATAHGVAEESDMTEQLRMHICVCVCVYIYIYIYIYHIMFIHSSVNGHLKLT